MFEIDDDLLCASMEHSMLLRSGRYKADFVQLWKAIDDLLDERLERMAAKDECDSEVI